MQCVLKVEHKVIFNGAFRLGCLKEILEAIATITMLNTAKNTRNSNRAKAFIMRKF